jgi:cellulose synthase/poly-beta-1,6-N-acetylglucosamine synthase-like glycosyltransferase
VWFDALLNYVSALDYPDGRLEVVVGSDGSTDQTDALVAACPDPRVRLSAAARGGKAAVLNRCIPEASGEIVVLSDANTMLDRGAVGKLVRHFRDPEVGAVCGRLKLYNRRRRDYEESLYWIYETVLKVYEGQHGAVIGANGGLYAVRRDLFTRLPSDTVVDDFVIPARLLEAGYRVVFDPEALAYEETTEDVRLDFARRCRIAAGNFQVLRTMRSLLAPGRGFVAFAYLSHKVLRWCAPALLVVALLSNLALAVETPYALLLALQIGLYGLAVLGRKGKAPPPLRRVAGLAYYFVSMNAALAVGFWRFLRGSQSPAWERVSRRVAQEACDGTRDGL